MTKRSASLLENERYQKSLKEIERLSTNVGMKHILANYLTDLALENKKLPDKLLSRKNSAAFKESVEKTIKEDEGVFEISGMFSIICATLVCMFLRACFLNRYVVNFSVDSLIAALAFAGLILNLRSQWKTVRFYGSLRDDVLLDLLGLALWFGLLLLFPRFDTSLIIFVLCYFIEKKKFKVQISAFRKENGLSLGLED